MTRGQIQGQPKYGGRAPAFKTPKRVRYDLELARFLGVRLRARRIQQKLAQQSLGHLADLSGKFIGEVERGEKSLSVESLIRLARALRASPREFIPDA